MLPDDIADTILTVKALLSGDIEWAIDGSCALALQGVDVTPHDIDILTDAEDAYRMESSMLPYVSRSVKYGETPRWRSHFGILYQ